MYNLVEFKNREYYWPDGDTVGWEAISNSWLNVEQALEKFTDRGTCIQAGGNNGLFPVLLSEHFNQVITFEPGPKMFDCMLKNIELHKCNNITAIHGALSDNKNELTLKIGPDTNLGSSFISTRRTSLNFPGETVDNIPAYLVDELELNDCSFLFLDVEGYEQFVLWGALKTITKFKPAIMLEFNDASSAYGFDITEIISWLKGQGYQIAHRWPYDRLFLPV